MGTNERREAKRACSSHHGESVARAITTSGKRWQHPITDVQVLGLQVIDQFADCLRRKRRVFGSFHGGL